MSDWKKGPVMLKVTFDQYDLESLTLDEYKRMGIKPPIKSTYGYIRIDQILSVQPSADRPGYCLVESLGNTTMLIKLPIEKFDEILSAHTRVVDYTSPDDIPEH